MSDILKKIREDEKLRSRILLISLLAVGFFVRLWRFGSMPSGLGQDEAYAAFDAWSLLHTGADSWGYRFPVYLVSWGSGMNALETYLMLPFLALFGLTPTAIRLPQLIVHCLSLPVFYDLLRRMFNRKTALIGLSLLVICPWHIQAARWGLESNMAPCFLLFGLYFFYLGAEGKPRFFLLSGLMYGLSLYSYAMTWIMVPVILLGSFLYLIRTKKLRITPWLIAGGAVLALLAIPLLLFIAVNSGLIPEIRTRFFSVPLMPVWRGSEVSFSLIWTHFKTTLKLLLFQKEEFQFSAEYGAVYHLSTPFVCLGVLLSGMRAFHALRKGEDRQEGLLLLGFLVPLAVGLMVDVCIIRINAVLFMWTAMAVIGLNWLTDILPGKGKRITAVILIAAYLVSFGGFLGHYFGGGYQQRGSDAFRAGLKESLAYAQTITAEDEDVYVMAYYPQVLLALDAPAQESIAQMVWVSFGDMQPAYTGRWHFIPVNTSYIDPFPAVLVIPRWLGAWVVEDYPVTFFEEMAVVDMRSASGGQ